MKKYLNLFFILYLFILFDNRYIKNELISFIALTIILYIFYRYKKD